MSTRTRSDWILWAQLGCALVATAHAEYTLALATGLHWVVASAVPGALDLYVIRALQKHKDVLPAVLVMVAANVASILVSAHVLPLHWGLYSAVGALVPLLVWRGHVLRAHEVQAAGAVSAPEYTAPEPSTPPGTDADWLPEFLAAQVHPVLEPGTPCELSEPLLRPADFMCGCGYAWGDHLGVQQKLAASAPALPPLPPEYAPEYIEQVHSELAPEPWSSALSSDDKVYLGSAQAYLAGCADDKRTPSIRGLKEFGHMSQDRSKRLLTYLKVIT